MRVLRESTQNGKAPNLSTDVTVVCRFDRSENLLIITAVELQYFFACVRNLLDRTHALYDDVPDRLDGVIEWGNVRSKVYD